MIVFVTLAKNVHRCPGGVDVPENPAIAFK
jgi:hypothetical protein